MVRLRGKLFVAIQLGLEPVLVVWAVLVALVARYGGRRFDVGLGPEPLINNVYHKRALLQVGYRAETFSTEPYFITSEFDRLFRVERGFLRLKKVTDRFVLIAWCLARYRVLYVYFHGALQFASALTAVIEPLLFRLARTKIVVMPYGGDVQDLTRSPNLLFKHAVSRDYPRHATRRRAIVRAIDRWTRWADCVVSGCEWVDYMPFWHVLTLGHFSIDVEAVRARARAANEAAPADAGGRDATDRGTARPLRVLHAPNHRAIKGTEHVVRAVEALQAEGVAIELDILERVPNEEVLRRIARADVIVDQLVIGWYAMFAIEAMVLEKPVVCYVRADLEELYVNAGLLTPGELPLVQATPQTVKHVLAELSQKRGELDDIGRRSAAYVARHHSLEAVGRVFADINAGLGVQPSEPSLVGERS